jgi:hypothetical protein
MYEHGEGVPQNYKEAIYWYRKAAEQGDADAHKKLGLMYVEGLGVIKDYVEAYTWWNVAAAQGVEGARKNRDVIAKDMAPAQLGKAQELSKVYYQKYVK